MLHISQCVHRLFVGCKAQDWGDLWWIIRCVTCDHLTSAVNWWSPFTVCVWMLWLCLAICLKCKRDVSSWQMEDFRLLFKSTMGSKFENTCKTTSLVKIKNVLAFRSFLFCFNYSSMWAAWTPQASFDLIQRASWACDHLYKESHDQCHKLFNYWPRNSTESYSCCII